jgi:ribosomal protein S18 acetylase RimI-like enzyme
MCERWMTSQAAIPREGKFMTDTPRPGLVKKQSLADTEIAEIRDLADICTRYEDLDLRLSWGMLQSRSGDMFEDFLYYQGGLLIGFLTLAGLGSDEAEVSGMVRPEYRRKGVFRALVEAAKEECRQNDTESLIFVCDTRSRSAKAFLESIGAKYEFSEQKMKLEQIVRTPSVDERLDLQEATVEDAATIADIIADDSGMNADFFRQVVANGIQWKSRQYYVAKVNNETIGTINVDVIDRDSYIYGFVIRPEHRGRGYGRQMLARTIENIVAERPQPVFLEVESDNTTALSLYCSFGFVITNTYDYYRLKT